MSDLVPVEYRTERVLTTEQLAQAYECEPNNIKKNFNSNKDHFVEGRHYYKVDGEELNDLRVTFSDLQISPKTRCLYLWTRRGASRHSKMLGTDKAWEMFDALEENYFNPRPKALTPAEQMAQGLIAAQQLLAEKDTTIAKQSQLIGELKPKADYTDRILNSKSLVTITQIAKDYGMSGAAMNCKAPRDGRHLQARRAVAALQQVPGQGLHALRDGRHHPFGWPRRCGHEHEVDAEGQAFPLPETQKARHPAGHRAESAAGVDDRGVSRVKKTYIDERGWQYAVRPGLGGDTFKGFYRKPGKSWHAVRVLTWFASEQEAEADLARWAAKKGMRCMEG